MPSNSIHGHLRNSDGRNFIEPSVDGYDPVIEIAKKILINTVREVQVAAKNPNHKIRNDNGHGHDPEFCNYCIGLNSYYWVKEDIAQLALWCEVAGFPAKEYREYVLEHDLEARILP